ncbi:hypothetical protein OSSY52_04850 [Tepiditoga spiralis]|uniref:HD-GYP domain-containing protein n=1 Tax=Tepiditoga spiralis TaxID=2108365 RepID=A0A7G1G5M7_9BACT|nr:HD-GYP domain-containing protein [Tepiditoga spiralis]BBE30344.1 hypothetical protein OSSY52_04850 [Tepiditoga spiralis]
MNFKIKRGIRFSIFQIVIMSLLSVALILFFLSNILTRNLIEKNYNQKKDLAISSIMEIFGISTKGSKSSENKYNLAINSIFDNINNLYEKNYTIQSQDLEKGKYIFDDLKNVFEKLKLPIPKIEYILFDDKKNVLYHSEMNSDKYIDLKNNLLKLINNNTNSKRITDTLDSTDSKYSFLNLDKYIFGLEVKLGNDEFFLKNTQKFTDLLTKQYDVIESIKVYKFDDFFNYDLELNDNQISSLKNNEQIILKNDFKETYFLPIENDLIIKVDFNKKIIYKDMIPIYFSFVIAIFVSLIIGLIVAHRVSNPLIKSIESISKSIKKYTEEKDLTAIAEIKLNKKSPYELINLSKGFTEMTQEISAYTEELQAMNEALENSYNEIEKKNKKLKEENYYFSKQLSKIAESYDDDTGNHIDRVASLSEFIAKKLNLNDDFIKDIKYFAPLHDIGKILTPIEILRKPGKLTNDEFEIIKKHPIDGGKLIGDGEEYKVARNIAMYHHEKYNGKGYPFGKIGDQIPIEAQIVSFADVYDALRSERPYKKAFSHEEVCNILVNGDNRTKPTDFNPLILEVFKRYHNEIDKLYNSLK